MALSSENLRPFRLYVTHVDGEGHFLKICGQLDQQSSLMIESLFEGARENLEKGIGAVPPGAIHEGVICAAKYKDGTYYRAKVISTATISKGLVGVHFIDFGNKDIISLSTIRFLDNYDPLFLQLRGQATDYYLSRIINPSGRWEEQLILKLQSLLCYSEYHTTIDLQTQSVPLISIQFKGNDLSTHLVTIRFGVAIPLAKQEVLMLQMAVDNSQQMPNWQSNYMGESPSYPEHVPFLINQNFPSNPASAMRLQQNVTLPFNGSLQPAPSLISQRLLVNNKVARNTVNLKAPARQPQVATSQPTIAAVQVPPTLPPAAAALPKPVSPKKTATYKSRLLEVNSEHKVYVSYADEGPELFAVQLAVDGPRFQAMMDDINKRPHTSLKEPPMIGTVCLGRMYPDRIICRAIVMNLSGSQCKLFFVDFGDTELVSYYDIFDIPEEYVKLNVFALRFCLSGVKKFEKGPHIKETFKQLVMGLPLTLKVVAPEGPPLIQYGELYLENKKNVFDLLVANMKDKLQFKWMEMLPLGTRQSVLVSYVDSCIKFYVQLSDKIDELNAVMDAVKVHCENSSSPGELPIGAACCARFSDDGNWYRARVRDTKGNKVIVSYVDYGNEQEVDSSDLRLITTDLIQLPAQAMKCALKGFENKPIETKTSNQLEMLALEKSLVAHIVGVLSSDTMLVTLVDDTVSPPLDIARKMNQLSQPRSSHEAKASTPIRKEGPDTISSPEGSIEGGKKNFRREKSFKDDRRPPREGNEDFGQRGGSFRGRDKEGFDRSGPGRHSEKYGGRLDRGDRHDRRGGPKPWENNTSPPAPQSVALPAEDDWEEESPTQTTPPKFNRDNRDNRDNRRKPRSDHQRPTWKKDSGLGKRLRQAAEAASADTQNAVKPSPSSVQDRLRRDKFSNHQSEDREERRNDDWGNRTGRDNRPDRRDNRDNRDHRGDRRDNWGEKKDNWGDKKDNWNQKREFGNRENREWNNDRPRSNFNPRDRADRNDRGEKSFGSDKSDRSFKSQDSNRGGRGAPFKPRSKFTQVQYKELSDPVSLDTPFAEPSVDLGAQHEISVTWIISPDSFYTQILSHQPKFLDMMHKIPELYKGVKPYTGPISAGASVLARYPADGVLYRATVVSVQPFSKFIVRYVDFGNKQLVDVRDIWQLDQSLMELPQMAVHCSLIGVGPKDGEWKAVNDPEIDTCFNAPRFQCVFQEALEDRYKVSLWTNGVSVADMLVEKGLCIMSEHQSSVTLKDEPIDMTIIVGQQILCRVTYVESFEKFYVQLDIDKAAVVEETIANFDVTKLTPLDAEIVTEGTHCTVKYEGKIYRAILQDVSDSANVKAVLPDYGNTITTSVENLMILPTELSVYYYQSLQCCLNNYTSESNTLISIDELKTKLTGNKFVIYINDVAEVVLVSTLYDCATGAKVAIFEPDEGAYDEVVPLCMRAVFNYNFGLAYISHAENLNEFYLQKAADGDRISDLLEELYKFYEEGTPEPLTSFEGESLCAVKSADGNWYRATIISSEENEVKVHYTDYGNSETVPKDSVKQLDSKFYEPCAQALVASLGLVALQEDALAKLTEWTSEKEVQVTLSFGIDGWLANLHLDGVDLSLRLINEKLAAPRPADADEPAAAAPEPAAELAPPAPPPPGAVPAYISHIDTPGHFWLQMADKVDAIEEIQLELQNAAGDYPELVSREMSTLCVAKYLADEQWYRAEILDSDYDITTVRFIDYGNTDVLDNVPGLIKELPDHLHKIERYAVKSSVNAVPTGTGEWSEAATEYFTELVGDLSAPVDAVIVLKDVTTYVDLYVGGENTTDRLVSGGHAARTEPATECGALPSCFASHVNSPAEFWVQLEAAAGDLQAMEAAMVDAETFPELTSREEGALCAAKYPEDGAWYRAQVVVDGSEGTEVLFMDYGNASIADELRTLPDDLKVKPPLSRKCALQKPRDIKSWSRKSEIKFNELAAEGATIFNVQFIASGDISIVELYLDGKSVTEELVELCEESPATERPTPVGQDLQTTAKICYVQSLDEFYVNLENRLSELGDVAAALGNAEELESTAELKVGSVCAAFWTEDETWYRAKILEFCDVGYHVLFIDFGNKAKCEDFRQLPEELVALEPLAKCCRLAGVPSNPVLCEAGKNKLDELACEDVTLQIEFLDSTKEPVLVKLFVDGKDFISTLVADVNTESPVEIKTIEAEATKLLPEGSDGSGNSKNEELSKEESEGRHDEAADSEHDDMAESNTLKDAKTSLESATLTETPTDAKIDVAAETVTDQLTDSKTDLALIETLTDAKTDVAKETDLASATLTETPTDSKTDVAAETTTDVLTDAKTGAAVEQPAKLKYDGTGDVKQEIITSEVKADPEIDETSMEIHPDDAKDSGNVTSESITDVSIAEESKPDVQSNEEIGEADVSNELNESFESTHTVIENNSFEAKADSLSDDIPVEQSEKGEMAASEKINPESLKSSNDTIKSIERDESKESNATDTGYASSGDKSFEKDAETPKQTDAEEKSPDSPVKEQDTPEQENASKSAKIADIEAKKIDSPVKETTTKENSTEVKNEAKE